MLKYAKKRAKPIIKVCACTHIIQYGSKKTEIVKTNFKNAHKKSNVKTEYSKLLGLMSATSYGILIVFMAL